MDFNWTKDQIELRRGATEFASRRLCEGVIDRDRNAIFARELWQACAEFGLQGLMVPEDMGGGGHDLLSAVAIMESIGYGARDNGIVFSVASHAASCEGPVAESGSPEQKARWGNAIDSAKLMLADLLAIVLLMLGAFISHLPH